MNRRSFLGFCLLAGASTLLSAQGLPAYRLPAPVAASYDEILAQPKNSGVAVFEYEGRPAITIIDFPTLAEQGRMFNRVVALIERVGAPRERVLGNDELANFIRAVGKTDTTFAWGNDFLIGELVVFFNLADLGNVPLNAEELALRDYLIERSFIVLRTGFYQARRSRAVILSIPRESSGGQGEPPVSSLARRTILTHEISHAEYYTNPLYAAYCRRFWNGVMTEQQRAAFRRFLAQESYNPDNEEMMINEMQAYLMYTPDPRAFNPRLVGLTEQEIETLRRRFLEGFPGAPLAAQRAAESGR